MRDSVYQFINFTNLSKNSGQKTHHSISQLINDEKHGLIWGYNPSNIRSEEHTSELQSLS